MVKYNRKESLLLFVKVQNNKHIKVMLFHKKNVFVLYIKLIYKCLFKPIDIYKRL